MEEVDGEDKIRLDVQALRAANAQIKVQLTQLQHLIEQFRALENGGALR